MKHDDLKTNQKILQQQKGNFEIDKAFITACMFLKNKIDFKAI